MLPLPAVNDQINAAMNRNTPTVIKTLGISKLLTYLSLKQILKYKNCYHNVEIQSTYIFL